jgi:hypothetical protein
LLEATKKSLINCLISRLIGSTFSLTFISIHMKNTKSTLVWRKHRTVTEDLRTTTKLTFYSIRLWCGRRYFITEAFLCRTISMKLSIKLKQQKIWICIVQKSLPLQHVSLWSAWSHTTLEPDSDK